MWLPPEENHEVTGVVRVDEGEGHYRIVGQGRGGAQLAHNKHMLHCVRQERFTYTHVSVVWLSEVWLCAKFLKGCAFTSSSPKKEVACVPLPAVCTSRSSLGSVVVVYPTSPPTVCWVC